MYFHSDLRKKLDCFMKKIITVAHSTKDWPRKSEGDSIELKDGRIFLAYMEFSGDGSDLARTRIVGMESPDGGISWHNHRVITETVNGDLNVYSPNLLRAKDGGILLIFMRQHSATPPSITLYVWKSTDECRSFTPISTFGERKDYSLCNAVVKRLSSGRILLPVSPTDNPEEHAYKRRGCGAVLYSDDDGLTWKEADNRLYLPMRGVMEPHVEEAKDGRILMIMRNQLGSIFMSESEDDGIKWSKPQTTGLRTPESCPELTRLPSTGDLLVIWNNSPYDPAFASHYGKRSPLTSAISLDCGRTWRNVKDIEDDPLRAFSNPGCRFTSKGKAVINYWTCEYLSNWCMQDIIDLRIALIDENWFTE